MLAPAVDILNVGRGVDIDRRSKEPNVVTILLQVKANISKAGKIGCEL